MKKNYNTLLSFAMVVGVFAMQSGSLFAQQSYTFTNAGATGSLGPTAANIATAYVATNLSGSVAMSATPGIQTFTIPTTMGYRIQAFGAQGFGPFGGRGASISGDFTLTAGTVLKILVGQMGVAPVNASANFQYGGGGGSFVTSLANVPYVVAGGGGGSWAGSFGGLSDGTVTTSGNPGSNGTTGAGGINGAGGGTGNAADGGAGIYGDGIVSNTNASPARSFTNGGTGGTYSYYGIGGFGGGGGTSSFNNTRGAGGGGYSGGGGSDGGASGTPLGGGGGSFNAGVNPTNVSGFNLGQGRVVITELCNVRITSSGSNSVSPSICAGTSLTLTTNAVSGYSWSTGNTTSSVIVVTPAASTVITVSGTSSLGCSAATSISITVSNALPSLTVVTGQNPICPGASSSLSASGAVTYTWSGGITNGQIVSPLTTTNYTVTGQNGCGISSTVRTISVTPLVVNTLASPTLVCQGYTAALTAVSAVNGYTWSTPSGQLVGSNVVVAPIANTIYTVSASDGTCVGTQTVEVTTKTTPTIVPSMTFVTICLGESINLSANGAGAGGSYSWTPGNGNTQTVAVAPTTSTLYTVIGTNSLNCAASAFIPVQVMQGPAVSALTNKTMICAGGTAVLTATGATTYTWVSGPSTNIFSVTPAATTVYSVTGANTTNTCQSTATVQVAVFAPSPAVTPSTQICAGANATLTATGANSYTWVGVGAASSLVVSPFNTTNYTVIALSQSLATNCTNTLNTTVKVNALPTISVSVSKTTAICKGLSNTLTATGASTYSWSNNATTATVVVSPSVTSIYSVTGIDANGCEGSQQVQITVSKCTGITEWGAESNMLVFPNPNAGEFTIRSDKALSLKLYNVAGQDLGTFELSSANGYEVKITDLSNGLYFIRNVQDAGNGIRIIVNK